MQFVDERQCPALEADELRRRVQHAVQRAAPLDRRRQPLRGFYGRLRGLQGLLGLGQLGASHVPASGERVELQLEAMVNGRFLERAFQI